MDHGIKKHFSRFTKSIIGGMSRSSKTIRTRRTGIVCVCFDELEPVRVEYIEVVGTVQITVNENFKEIQLPLKNSQMQQLQRHDDFCREIARKLTLNKHMNKLFMMKQGIVYRLWCENNKTEECIVVPEVL